MHPLISGDLVREIDADRRRRADRRRAVGREHHAVRATLGVWLVNLGADLIEGADREAGLMLAAPGGPARGASPVIDIVTARKKGRGPWRFSQSHS
jgi:hypothetical protein